MSVAVFLGVLLLFLAACVAAVVFAVRRHGLERVLIYVVAVIVIRVLIQSAAHNIGTFEEDIVPLLGAAAIVWAWPRIVANRALDKASADEHEEEEQNSHESV